MTAVKFCGVCNEEDLRQAAQLGVDAVGFVLYDKSPRAVDVDEACRLAKMAPPFLSVVALVVNMPEQDLVYLAHHMPFDVVQFHGNESAHQCHLMADRVCKRWTKAIAVAESDTPQSLAERLDELWRFGANGAVLDTYATDKFGGTGFCFDWTKIPENPPLPLILAGGLNASNVRQAASQKGVYGVDVSGGIESAPGKKCPQKMRDFLQALRA